MVLAATKWANLTKMTLMTVNEGRKQGENLFNPLMIQTAMTDVSMIWEEKD